MHKGGTMPFIMLPPREPHEQDWTWSLDRFDPFKPRGESTPLNGLFGFNFVVT
jgi:hypothetical protein